MNLSGKVPQTSLTYSGQETVIYLTYNKPHYNKKNSNYVFSMAEEKKEGEKKKKNICLYLPRSLYVPDDGKFNYAVKHFLLSGKTKKKKKTNPQTTN